MLRPRRTDPAGRAQTGRGVFQECRGALPPLHPRNPIEIILKGNIKGDHQPVHPMTRASQFT